MASSDENRRVLHNSTRVFAQFFQNRLRPVVEDIGKRKKAALKKSLLAAIATFAVFGAGAYLFFAPYAQMLGDHKITYWPILVLLPTTMAVIAFSICYILMLRGVVRDFRESLVRCMAEHIDPELVHDPNRRLPGQDIERSLLFEAFGSPAPGNELFHGRAGETQVELADLRVECADDQEGRAVWRGLFFKAVFERRFRTFMLSLPEDVAVSLGNLGGKLRDAGELGGELVRLDSNDGLRHTVVESAWQGLVGRSVESAAWKEVTGGLRERGVRTLVSFRGKVLSIAMVSRKEGAESSAKIFDDFDFGGCREFCRDARLCLNLALQAAANRELFAE